MLNDLKDLDHSPGTDQAYATCALEDLDHAE